MVDKTPAWWIDAIDHNKVVQLQDPSKEWSHDLPETWWWGLNEAQARDYLKQCGLTGGNSNNKLHEGHKAQHTIGVCMCHLCTNQNTFASDEQLIWVRHLGRM